MSDATVLCAIRARAHFIGEEKRLPTISTSPTASEHMAASPKTEEALAFIQMSQHACTAFACGRGRATNLGPCAVVS
jgi:hypothetical protein